MTWISPEFEYLSQWKYLEIAHYVKDLDRVIRDQSGTKDNRVPILLEWGDVEEFRRKNNNLGIYTSVWRYNDRDLSVAKRLGSLYFDLDSDDVQEAQMEAIKLVDYLVQSIPRSGIRVYFTGAKGFHIECEAVTVGITPSNGLPALFRYIASGVRDHLSLTTLDFSVYDQRRMWRLPNSQHQKTGLYKVALSHDELQWPLAHINKLAEGPREEVIPELTFNAKANEWYREWSYKQEAGKTVSLEERIARFNKHGTNLVSKHGYDEDQMFDPEALFTHCPALLRLWEKAEREHHLLHDERLFLCSILTYTDEAIDYLIQILSNCNDFNMDKSMSHINDWVRRREMNIGGHPYSCAKVNAMGIGCGNCDLKPKERMEKVGSNWIATGEYADPSPIRYGYHKRNEVPGTPVVIDASKIKRI